MFWSSTTAGLRKPKPLILAAICRIWFLEWVRTFFGFRRSDSIGAHSTAGKPDGPLSRSETRLQVSFDRSHAVLLFLIELFRSDRPQLRLSAAPTTRLCAGQRLRKVVRGAYDVESRPHVSGASARLGEICCLSQSAADG